MKHIIKYISVLATLLFMYSCQKEVLVDLNSSTPQIVIEGLVPLDSLASVKITKSKDYNTDGVFPAVNGAVVTITDNAGNSEILKQNKDGLYVAQTIRGTKGRSYNLSVNVEDHTYSSSSSMPTYVAIDSLYMYEIPAFDFPMPMVKLTDPKGENNYYRFIVYINGRRTKTSYVDDDDNRDGYVIERLLPVSKQDNFDNDIVKGDHVRVELQCIDKDVYTFFETLGRISQTLTNPTSNIKGGALGYFSAYTSDSKSIIAQW